MSHKYVLIKGGGDLASGAACVLHKAGFPVIMTEIPKPTCVRRKVSFAEAVYQGETWVEDVKGILVSDFSEAQEAVKKGVIALMIDPEGSTVKNFPPEIFLDASMTKKNYGTNMNLANIVIALGPGFEGGKDAHAVIETQRGPNLGKTIFSGFAEPDTGIPGDVMGYTSERLLRAPAQGVFREVKTIGDFVEQGEIVAYADDTPVKSKIAGTVRGLLKSGLNVHQGMKVGDIHPEKDSAVVGAVTDKAWTIGMGVLKAVLALREKSLEDKRKENLEFYSCLDRIMAESRTGMSFTLIDSEGLDELKIGSHLLFASNGEVVGSLGIPSLDQDMAKIWEENKVGPAETQIIKWETPWAKAKGNITGKVIKVLQERIVPQKKLIIFGGGHISLPLAEMARILGYQVIVVDDREEFANPTRFSGADKILCASFADVLKKDLLADDLNCAASVVIVTRGHRQDKTCVQYLVGRDLSYIGMIGSKIKVKQTFAALLEEGYPREQLEKISAPIGLDLGGQSPAEIALSILAEIIAKEYKASGRPVKEVKGVLLP